MFQHLLVGVLVCAALAQAQAKMNPIRIAVLPLSAQGVDAASAQVLTDALSDELMKSGNLRVMERSQMVEVLKEQGFQNNGACDQGECAVQMGKLLGIEKLVVGSLGKFGNTYTLTLRGVNVGTGEVDASVRRTQIGEVEAVLTGLLPVLAKDLSQQLSGGKTDSAEPIPAVGSGRSRVGLWIAGGVVLAGGATAAAILLSGKSTTSTTTVPVVASNNQNIHVVQP